MNINCKKTLGSFSKAPNLVPLAVQWRKSGWNSGGRRADLEGLFGVGRGEGREGVTPHSTGRRVWRGGYAPSPEKQLKFHLKWRVFVLSEQYFLYVSLPEKMLIFSPE